MKTTIRTLLTIVALALFVSPAGAQFDNLFGGGSDGPALTVRAVPSVSEVVPGQQISIAVVLEHAEHYHTWPVIEQDVIAPKYAEGLLRTNVAIGQLSEQQLSDIYEKKVRFGTLPEGYQAGPLQLPEPKPARVFDPTGETDTIELPTYAGQAVVYVPLIVGEGSGDVRIPVSVMAQACDETSCLAPELYELEVVLTLGFISGTPNEPELFAGFDSSIFAKMLSGDLPAELVEFNVFGWEFSIDPGGALGMVLLLAVAALGGFVLNLTPCVLPVVPIKIMGLSQTAGNRARTLYLGIVMSIGVIAFFMAIGGAIAFLTGFTAISSLFQTPGFAIVVGVIIAVMGVGMIGVFTTGLPNWVYTITPKHDSTIGSFLWGVLTAVLSTPCTAPFMGAATAWAATQNPSITLATFGAIGLGMAMPYLVLSANPKWVDRVPRTGPASELVKQVMGLLLLAVAAFFIGTGLSPFLSEPNAPAFRGHWWLVAAFACIAAFWLVFRTFKITRSLPRRAIWLALASVFVVGNVALAARITDKGPIDWEYYTPALFQEAIDRGDVVVIDFTAEWCLNCKALESGVLHQKSVATRLNGAGVTAIKVDLTGDNREGKAFLQSLDWVGIPLLAIYGPEASEPIKLGDGYTTGVVLKAIDQAAGGPLEAAMGDR